MGRKRKRIVSVEVYADVDIDVLDVIEQIDDDDLIAEMEERGLTKEIGESTPVLVKMIISNYNIIQADKIKEFFKNL